MRYEDLEINPKVAEALLNEPIVVDAKSLSRNRLEYTISIGPYVLAKGKSKKPKVFDEIETICTETVTYLESVAKP